jgi:hypothetical protein
MENFGRKKLLHVCFIDPLAVGGLVRRVQQRLVFFYEPKIFSVSLALARGLLRQAVAHVWRLFKTL